MPRVQLPAFEVDGYIRVSHVGHRQAPRFVSPHVQREQIESWASACNAQVLSLVEDLDQSGARVDADTRSRRTGPRPITHTSKRSHVCSRTGACYPQHRHQEFLAFLNQLVRAYPRRALHVVLDNSSTHSTPEVERWLARHKRVQFHFTPTSASWMNMVEIWFSVLTNQQVRRGVYHDVPELIAAIEHFIAGYNQRAQPFVWTKTADAILAKATKQQPTSGTLH
ncbi:MAG: IS630 family transposase [Actinomycetota bacterium]|jgi:hypothetical protein|nr:IS630 family transposase [Actinomycetota bacterium]